MELVFESLILLVITFIAARVLYWIAIEIPRGHAKDEAICEKCWGKKISDDVTEPLEWCNCDSEGRCDECSGIQKSSDTTEIAEWCDCPMRKTSDEHK